MAKNSITIKSYVDNREEFVANAAITPGHLVEIMSTGKLRAHATAAGNAAKRIALEDDMQGNGVDTAYSAGNVVQTKTFLPGEKFLGILKDGETATIGSLLESAGNGELQVVVTDYGSNIGPVYPNNIVGIAREALDLSGSSGEEPTRRLVVEVI